MGLVEDTAAKLLRQLAVDVEAGLVDVYHEKRTGCGASGCVDPDYWISVQHRHIPVVTTATEEA